ncbi:MAG: hypothetical protein FGM14_14620 [Flavobacteriales bacterium]|nr:hypothetical protein [Flavobacteriales bacterium]
MENESNYFDDDGTPLNPNLFPKPQLCLSCKKNEDESEEILCNLTRLDQRFEAVFKCYDYEQI